MPEHRPIYVTRPALPPLDEFTEYLGRIWETHILTNNGPFHKEFERALAEYLGVKYISLFANGTLALITALQALRISGEVITTPFSFVATTHALWWNNIKPVFADIEPSRFNLDPEKVEEAITPQTTAILAVHVYGNPCRDDQLREIAATHGLKLIYDAAHAFGVTVDGMPVADLGDITIMSFHATKVFSTVEGGAVICRDEKTKKRIDHLKNFGFAGEITVIEPGINAKMNEFQAAFGLLQLKYVDRYIAERKEIAGIYRRELAGIPGLSFHEDMAGVRHSYTYFPIFIDERAFGLSRDDLHEDLKKNGIYGRRYFYPLISNIPVYQGLPSAGKANLPVANTVAGQVLCLPIYPGLDGRALNKIIGLLTGRRSRHFHR